MMIYNSLTRKKETFTPGEKDAVSFYLCGPTVYDVGHLGHARAAVSFDVIRRFLIYKGFQVKFVSNYTDVDDKIIRRAKELGISEKELAAKIIPEYEKDYGTLKILPSDITPRATEYIPEMVKLVSALIDKGYAYATEDGVYFEVQKFKDYGKLSGQKPEELLEGARIAVDEKKKNPEDFALWKKEKPGEPSWEGPEIEGRKMRGRPGWHIECSAMTMKLLGETFDIHGGGKDLIFPHHEDEIAQSEAATGKPFARYWMHNGHVEINKEKMSKSLGNFFTIKEVLAKYNPSVVRYFLLSTHYRLPINYAPKLLEQAKASLSRLQDFWSTVKRMAGNAIPGFRFHSRVRPLLQKLEHDFTATMDDDFEISETLAAIFEFVRVINGFIKTGEALPEDLASILEVFKKFDSVLAVMEPLDTLVDSEIEALIKERDQARASKDFKRSDEIRIELQKRGILLEDSASGTRWKRAL